MAVETLWPEKQHMADAPQGENGIEVNGRSASALPLRLLLCTPPQGLDPAEAAYARALTDRLQGQMDEGNLARAAAYDLVLTTQQAVDLPSTLRSGASVLIMGQPRWPLRHLLLICRAEPSDVVALPWVKRLATAETAVTLLVVVPCIPAVYRLAGPQPLGLHSLLHPDTTSGQHIRRLLQALSAAGITARVRLRDGEPDEQIRREAATSLYELIVIAREEHGRLRHAVLGELVTPMLAWLNTPLLLAKETLSARP
ncbi:MAG: universal stress protein [Anaerolineales bacterium]|nr:universal stress protein [Anaerolineales bacterium]